MIQALKYFQLSANALAACLLVSACGGGAAEAPVVPVVPVVPGISDTTPPTLVITDNVTAASATGSVTFTFTFSEDVGTSFTAADVLVTGGTAGTFTKINALNYTLVVAPTANASGSINVSIAAGAFSDLASNLNTAAATASQAFNTTVTSPSGNTGTCATPTCIDFSGTAITFTLFENNGGTAELADDPKDAMNRVTKYVKTPADNDYFGTVIKGGPSSVVLTATNKTVTMRVLSPSIGTNMLLKFEGGTGGPATTEKDVLTTKANEWETLTFDMPDAGTYTTVVLFPNGRSKVATTKDIYVDEVKFPAVGGGSSNAGTLTAGKWASAYSGAKSVEGGDFGNFVDSTAPTEYADGGVSPIDAGDPNFYFGYGFNDATKKATYLGAFVKAPGNGNIKLGSYTTLNIFSWGNIEWLNLSPTFTVILQGAPVAGCASNSGASEVKLTFVANSAAAKSYALNLANATVNFACNSEANAAAILTAGISQINVIADGSVNINYTTKAGTAWPNFMNVGKMTFN
jgi:Bacterial Ig-like domain